MGFDSEKLGGDRYGVDHRNCSLWEDGGEEVNANL